MFITLRNFYSHVEENIGYFENFVFETEDNFIAIEIFDCGLFTEKKINIFDKNHSLLAVGLDSEECSAYDIEDTKSFDVPSKYKHLVDAAHEKISAFRAVQY